MLNVTPQIQVPLSEIQFSYVRSSGPGGQNVNKVNSKAVLRWNLRTTTSIPHELWVYLVARLADRLTTEGEIVLTSDRFRDQIRNREDCLEKLRTLLLQASHRPTARKKTRPSRSSRLKRKESKTVHSRKKALRKAPRGW